MMCVKWDQMGNVISVKDGRRFLPIHELCSSLSEITCRVLPVAKYHLKKIDTSFHQPLPNMVQRLCADVINDAILFMNIHEQNHP
jgi:hypothetical protein